MSTNLSSVPKLQFFDNNGNPLVGGKLFTYAAGTTTPLATYTDSTGVTPNTNPIILDSRGEANVWLDATQYKFELKTSVDALIWTVDNISNALNLSQLLANSGSAASPPYTFAADTTTGMYLAAAGQIGLSANGTPVLRSTDTQMIIGQSGGANDVDVTHFGDTAQTGNVTQTGNVIQTGNWTLTGDVNVTGAAVFNEAGADKDFRVEGDTDANLLFVDASTDRVGVGTNAPAHTLDVNVASASFRVRNATGGNDFTVKSVAGPITQIGSVANTPLQILTNDLARIHVAAAGNVGIGTTSPTNKFVVSNNGAAGLEITPDGLASNPILVSFNRSTSAYGQLSFGSDFLVFCTNGTTEQARITSAGLLQFNSGYGSVATAFGCRAWVNFDGTLVTNPASTTGIRGSGNVSSVLDNGTGDYTINFTNPMPDGNYAAVGLSKEYDNTTGTTLNLYLGKQTVANTLNANFVRVFSGTGGSGTATDGVAITVAVFR